VANDLEFGISVGGIDEAAAAMQRVDQAQQQVATAQTRRFAQSVEQIREQAEFSELLAAAHERDARAAQQAAEAVARSKARESAAFDQVVQSARQQTDALRNSARATQDAGAAANNAATTAIAFATKIQGAVSAVTALSGALGDRNETAGLVANVAATTAQFAQLGSLLGPGGALVSGVLGFSYAVAELVEATHTATTAQTSYRTELGISLEAIDEYIEATERLAAAQRRTSLIDQGLGDANEQFAAANIAGQRVGEIAAARSGIRQQANALRGSVDSLEESDALLALDRQFDALTRELEIARAESQRLGELALQAQEDQLALQEDEVTIAMDRDQASHGRRGDPETERLRRMFGMGGGGRSQTEIQEQNWRGFEERERLATETMRALAQERIDLERGYFEEWKRIDDEKNERRQAGVELERQASRELAESDRQKAESQRALAEEAADAAKAFEQGWMTSIDQVVDAYSDANRALRAAGQQMLSSSRLIERGLVAVGNNIAETIGDKMTGAFEEAVGAWVTGAKSFEQAAADMAKSIIQSLVIESIVQAVVETARAISDFASYRYDSGAMHLAAAAAWAGVGIVAGAVGAGIGAFGGGGDKGAAKEAPDGKELSSRSLREGESTQPIVVNVYPGWASAREQQQFVYGAINGGARDGMRIDPRAQRGTGRG
jgi:hypothetical protein